MQIPQKVKNRVEEYRQDSDPLGEFISECCEVGTDKTVGLTKLRELYEKFEFERGSAALSKTDFVRTLKERDFRQGRSGKARYWKGIAIIGAEPQSQPVSKHLEIEPVSLPDNVPNIKKITGHVAYYGEKSSLDGVAKEDTDNNHVFGSIDQTDIYFNESDPFDDGPEQVTFKDEVHWDETDDDFDDSDPFDDGPEPVVNRNIDYPDYTDDDFDNSDPFAD